MEFDNNSPVSDEQRRLAESKKITLQPIHTEVTPEDTPDSEIAARHAAEPAIANIEGDIEQDTARIQPSRGLVETAPKKPAKSSAAVVVTVLAVLGVSCAAIASVAIISQ